MTPGKNFLLLGAAALAALMLGQALLRSPEQVIRRKIDRLMLTVSLKSDDGNLTKAAKINRFGDFFTRDVKVNLGDIRWTSSVFNSRAELRDAFKNTVMRLKFANVQASDITIEVAKNSLSARVQLLVEAAIDIEERPLRWNLQLNYEKTEEGWRIRRVRRESVFRQQI